jgi:hypothetical protein
MISQGLQGLGHGTGEVCVVGTGPAGLTVALELARQGKRVVLLESGSERASQDVNELSAASLANPKVHDDVRITVSRQLGGTSNLWGARCQPYDPVDFEARPWAATPGWPLAFAELEPWYQRACEILRCGAAVFDDEPIVAADDRVLSTRLERFSTEPRMQLAHAKQLRDEHRIDIRLGVTVVDIDIDHAGCVRGLVACDQGGQRHTLPVNAVVLAMGGLETTRLLLAVQRRNAELFGGAGGPLGRYYMAHLVGEVADIRFSAGRTGRAFDFFIDRHGSYARRRLIPSADEQRERQLPNVSFWPVVPAVADAKHRSALLSTVFLAMAFPPLGRRLVAEAIRRYHAPPGTPIWPHVSNIVRDLPSAVAGSLSFLRRRYLKQPPVPGFFIRNPSHTYGLSYHSEHFPDPASRVTLQNECDALGLPRLHVDLRFHDADAQALFRAHDLLREWLATTGVGELRYRQPVSEVPAAILRAARHGTHQIGLARMAAHADEGVVDSNLKVFGLANLYLAGSAVFPTSGQANPTLTIVALAARLASHLARR